MTNDTPTLGTPSRASCSTAPRAAVTAFAAGDAIVFCEEVLIVESNQGDYGDVRYLDGSFCQSKFLWTFEGELCRRATAAELAPYAECGLVLAQVALSRLAPGF